MSTFRLIVSSPDGSIFDGEVEKLDVRGVEGELAVMAGHIPFVTGILDAPCTLWLEDGSKKTARAGGGLLTVGRDYTTLLAGTFRFEED